jgi:hypothetical protein
VDEPPTESVSVREKRPAQQLYSACYELRAETNDSRAEVLIYLSEDGSYRVAYVCSFNRAFCAYGVPHEADTGG